MRRAVRAIVIKDDALLVMHRNKFGEQYYILVGGAIHGDETPEQALHRELMDEASLSVANPRLVFVEEADEPYGTQYIYLCDYVGGRAVLSPESDEAQIHKMGSNLFTPMWLPVGDLPDVPFVPAELKAAIIQGLLNGFPTEPIKIQAN
jgi:8-oxo-dGTP diphosphatase